MQQTIIVGGIFAAIFFVILLFYNNEKTFEKHRELSSKDMDKHVLAYEQNFLKNSDELARNYIESLPPLISPSVKKQSENQTDNYTLKTKIPELDYILSNQELKIKSDLKQPARYENLASAIGEWRCREGRKLSASPIDHDISLHKFKKIPLDLISIDCSHLKTAEVLRVGNELGGWLIHFKEVNQCPFYIINSGGSECAKSIKNYMAMHVFDNSRRIETLKLNEEIIVEGMSSVKSMPFEQAVSEVFEGYSDRKYTHDKDKEPLVLKRASETHMKVLKILGQKLPKMVLTPKQTFAYFKSNYLSLVRLWDGEKFNTVRVTPQMYSDSVVVVAEQYMGTRLIEINANGEQVYIDMSESKAYGDFESWIKYLLAKRRLFESGYEFKHFPWD